MIAFLWYGRKMLLPNVIFVLRRYAGYIFFLAAGRWPGRDQQGHYLTNQPEKKP